MIGLVVLTPIPQVAPASWLCVTVAFQNPAPVVTAGTPTPDEFLNVLRVMRFVAVVEYVESEKNASSAVTRFRRSDFIAVTYAFDFVLANFGIAIAAKMPMMTTTISSSMSVKPFRARSMLDMEWS